MFFWEGYHRRESSLSVCPEAVFSGLIQIYKSFLFDKYNRSIVSYFQQYKELKVYVPEICQGLIVPVPRFARFAM